MSFGTRAVLFFCLMLVFTQAPETGIAAVGATRLCTTLQSTERAQSFGQMMIVFIRSILEEKPKAIDESLVRDDE